MSKHHYHSCCDSHSQCGSHSHHGSHHHGCCCQPCGSSHEEHDHHACNFAEHFLEVADEAWIEVLKEKIKDHIRKNDEKMDELVKIIAEANKEKWKKKILGHKCCETYEQQIHQFFDSRCSDACSKK